MNKYNYKKIDWSKLPSIERYTDTTNGNKMDIEVPEEYQNIALENNIKKENTSYVAG